MLVGNGPTRGAGALAQARSVAVLKNRDVAGQRQLRSAPARGCIPEGLDVAVLQGIAEPVDHPDQADVALVRIAAPFEPRDDLFLESYFHQGSLELRPGLVHRLRTLTDSVPVVLDVALDRPAILTPLVEALAGLTVTFGVSDESWLAALTGRVPPEGRLPVELPRSMEAVRGSAPRPAGRHGRPALHTRHRPRHRAVTPGELITRHRQQVTGSASIDIRSPARIPPI